MSKNTSDQKKTKPVSKTAEPAKHSHPHQVPDPDKDVTDQVLGKNIVLTITIPWADVQKGYKATLQSISTQIEMPGFRKGKVPAKLVEEKVGKTKIYEESISKILSPAYSNELKKQNIHPIVEPHVHAKSMDEGKDWVFEIETAETPTVTLGEYKDAVKTARAKHAIILPGNEPKKDADPEEEKIKVVFQALLETTKLKIPELLIRYEVNRSISKMMEQLDRIKIPFEDYLKSVNKKIEDIRQEYALQALTSLQLEFVLSEIAKQEKLEVADAEIDAIIATFPDEKLRTSSQSAGQRAYIASTLLRRKTVEMLLVL